MHGGAFAHNNLPFFEDSCLIQGSTFSKQMVFHVFFLKMWTKFRPHEMQLQVVVRVCSFFRVSTRSCLSHIWS